MTRFGTSHFVSRAAARRYYGQYGNTAAHTDCKIAEGEIHIGPPVLKPGQRLTIIDEGARYAIEEG